MSDIYGFVYASFVWLHGHLVAYSAAKPWSQVWSSLLASLKPRFILCLIAKQLCPIYRPNCEKLQKLKIDKLITYFKTTVKSKMWLLQLTNIRSMVLSGIQKNWHSTGTADITSITPLKLSGYLSIWPISSFKKVQQIMTLNGFFYRIKPCV